MYCFMENTNSPAEFIALISRQMLRFVPVVIQGAAYIPLVRVYAGKLVMLWNYFLTLMHEEIISQKLKNTVHALRNSVNWLG